MANETPPAPAPAPKAAAAPAERVTFAEYAEKILATPSGAKGMLLVKARRGYEVMPTDKTLPMVNEVGVPMTVQQYEALREEAGQYLVARVEEIKE